MNREIKFKTINLITKSSDTFGFDNDFDCETGWLKDKVLLQFTGMKDKTGKEIYEGDICKRDTHVELYEIVFYKNAWAIKNETKNAIWHQEFCNGARSSHLTVIGNIYENEALLHTGALAGN